MGYKLARLFIHLLFRLIARVRLEGLENLPAHGPYIAAANHIGRLDAALVFYILDRRDILMLIAEKYRKNALFRWLAKQFDAVFIDRYNADLVATRTALKRLKEGWALVIAPEGTRSETGALQPGWAGASYLAAKSGVPIVPVGVTGSDDAQVIHNLKHFRRTQILARAGQPFHLPPLTGGDRAAQLQASTDEIMLHIAALLPESRRGVYKDHPRLPQLLEQGSSQTSAH